MTWVKLDDAFDENAKVVGLTDAAFRLYVKALCWCARKETDGRIPRSAGIAFAKPLGKHRSVDELVDVGLWLETDIGFEVKDYLTYNPSHAQLEASRLATKGRVRGHRASKGNASGNAGNNGATPPVGNGSGNAVTPGPGNAVGTPPSRIPDPDPGERSPPSPSAKVGKPDRFMGSFAPFRDDVRELHETYKRTFALAHHALESVSDLNYETLARAIDAQGLQSCLALLAVAKQDGMVNGSADDKRVPHEKISYLFGNPDTLARLLRLVDAAERKRSGSGVDPVARAREAQPDLSGYVPPAGAS